MTHLPSPFEQVELRVLPTPFGHLEYRIDRRDPRPTAVAKAALLRRSHR
jgi:hypothetical protein